MHPTKHILWSATPTPFDDDLRVDSRSVRHLVEHHIALGIQGIMLGGSCGEGPWMPVDDLESMTRTAVQQSAGRIQIAVQVTDNSATRMLQHIERLARAGADSVVVAAPYLFLNATPERIFGTYEEVIRKSELPVIYYDRGANDRYRVENERLPELLALPNLFLVKDSSGDTARAEIGTLAMRQRPELQILTGDEFHVVGALRSGMRGAFLGGAIFNTSLVLKIFDAHENDDNETASMLQSEMNDFMFRVYGGKQVRAWLTGLKYFLHQLGIFSTTASYLEYPLCEEDKSAIDELFHPPLRERLVEPLLLSKAFTAL